MHISTAEVGHETTTEVEVREHPGRIEVRVLTPRTDPNGRPVHIVVNGKEVWA